MQNLAAEHTFHLVNGAFSNRFHEVALHLGRQAVKAEVPAGRGFGEMPSIAPETEMICVVQNETSTGAALPLEFIHRLRDQNPNALLVVDAVSSLPYPAFDFTRIDSLFFSVQKGFGLPAGLGVWMVNERCIARAESLLSKGCLIGSYHSIASLLAHEKKNQTPETPNVLGIYLLGRVIQDFLRRGVTTIRRETEYKSAILYNLLMQHQHLSAFVAEPEFQSKTVIVVKADDHVAEITRALQKRGITPGDGYGAFRKSQMRFANFPAHSKEQYELLVDILSAFKG